MTSSVQQFSKRLQQLGVPDEEEIAKSKEPKQTKLSKAIKWISNLSTKRIQKGLEQKLPDICSIVKRLLLDDSRVNSKI